MSKVVILGETEFASTHTEKKYPRGNRENSLLLKSELSHWSPTSGNH